MESNRYNSVKDLSLTSPICSSKNKRPIRLKNLNEARALMKTLGKSQDFSLNNTTFFSEETTLNLTTSFISTESAIKCKLQSPKYKQRSEMSLSQNELMLAIASAANKSLTTLLSHDRAKKPENPIKISQSDSSASGISLTLKDCNNRSARNLKNVCEDKGHPNSSFYKKTPDVSPIRPEPIIKSSGVKKEIKTVQKHFDKTKTYKPNLPHSKKFESIFNEKILPVLLKSTKLKQKPIENPAKNKADPKPKKVENSQENPIINRLLRVQPKKK